VGAKVTSAELVGRTAQVEVLDAALDRAQLGAGGAVLVGGEAGIGKTRLVHGCTERARELGFLGAVGAASPVDGRGLAYGPVVELLRNLERRLEPEGAELLAPALRALGLPGTDGSTDGSTDGASPFDATAGPIARTWLVDTVLSSLLAIARRVPTMLVVEDLHWADAGTLGVVDHLVRSAGDDALVIVGTYRTEEVAAGNPLRSLLAETFRSANVSRLELGPLPDDDVDRLVRAILGRPAERGVLQAVRTRAGGNPFLVEELLAQGEPGRSTAALRDIVLGRVERVSQPARRVLAAASVVGPHVDHELLLTLSGLGPDAFDTAAGEALDRQLLIADDDDAGYRFRHELTRECVYDSLLPGDRGRIHGQVAALLSAHARFRAAGPGYGDAELARHWWAAGEWEHALRAAVVAADAAEEVFAFDESLYHLEHALASLDRLDTPPKEPAFDRLQLVERTAEAAYLAGSGPRSMELANAAIAMIDRDAEPVAAGMAYVRLARNAWSVADQPACFEALEHAEALIPPDPPTPERARVLAEKGRGLMLISRYREGASVCTQAVEVARAAAARAEEGHALNSLGVCRAEMGTFDEGIELVERAWEIAEELRRPEDINRAMSNISCLLYRAGRLEDAVDLFVRKERDGGDPGGVLLQSAAMNACDALIDLGRWVEAERIMASVGGMMGNCSQHPAQCRAILAIRRGQLDGVADVLRSMEEHFESLADVQFLCPLLLCTADLAIAEGRYDDADTALLRALDLIGRSDDVEFGPAVCATAARSLADRAAAATARGMPADVDALRGRADVLVREAGTLVERAGDEGQAGPRTLAFLAQARAEASRLARGTPGLAGDASLWADAEELWTALHQPYETAYCQWRQADALLASRTGRRRAEALVLDAWETAATLGAGSLTAPLEEVAGRARIPLGADDPGRRSAKVGEELGLTIREVEVLGLLVAHRTDGQIAQALYISKKTASVHVSNILRKLGAANRIEAGEIGRQAGLEPVVAATSTG
jgi:DNA-binding CsgD family transcriptional regulator/tetratricopeptide (TPR) repeat protein